MSPSVAESPTISVCDCRFLESVYVFILSTLGMVLDGDAYNSYSTLEDMVSIFLAVKCV